MIAYLARGVVSPGHLESLVVLKTAWKRQWDRWAGAAECWPCAGCCGLMCMCSRAGLTSQLRHQPFHTHP